MLSYTMFKFAAKAGDAMESNRSGMNAWEVAAASDDTLGNWRRYGKQLARKRISPLRFSRSRLFSALIDQQPVIFANLRIPIGHGARSRLDALFAALEQGAPSAERIRIRTGAADTQRYVPAGELVARWRRGTSTFCVTDFHFRGTRLESLIDLTPLSDFNLLAQEKSAGADQEMMTLVLSSKGALTDSHSDDPDGSNHCVSGHKLWLVWDTQEGCRAGLQDVERNDVYGKAALDLDTFCQLKTSRWFSIRSGHTLFLPGCFTHKVITIERYAGFGSFCVALPNYLQTITRWTCLPPLWNRYKSERQLVQKLTMEALARLQKLEAAGKKQRLVWGIPQLAMGMQNWLQLTPPEVRREVCAQADVNEFIQHSKRVIKSM